MLATFRVAVTSEAKAGSVVVGRRLSRLSEGAFGMGIVPRAGELERPGKRTVRVGGLRICCPFWRGEGLARNSRLRAGRCNSVRGEASP